MNVLAICAGVGGLELGIHAAEPRARGICYLEREVYAAANLVARMEDGWLHPAPIWSDLATFDPEPWRGAVHCIASGDPCQPNSVAGSRKGADDDRWLLDHVLSNVDCLRPDRVFRENVPGNADGQLAVIVPALEGMGYRVAAGIFSAAEAGASHRRERLFIMADRKCPERGAVDRSRGNEGEDCLSRRTEGSGGAGGGRENVADHNSHRQHPGSGDERGSNGPESSHRHDAERCGGQLGDSKGVGRGEGRPEHEFRCGRDAVASAGGELGNTTGSRFRAGEPGARRAIRDEAWGAQSGGRCIDVADPGSPVLQGSERRRSPGRGYGAQASGSTSEFCLPLFAPGPSDPLWTEIIGQTPHLEPAVYRVADGMAAALHEVIDEAEHDSQASAKSYFNAWGEMCRLRLDGILASTSRGLHEAAGGNLSLFDMPPASPPLPAGNELRNMRLELQAEEVTQRFNLWRSEVLERAWENIRSEKMGWSFSEEGVRLVRRGVCLYEGSPEDVLSVLREQVGMGQAMRNRVDRLRACGNGVVPLAAAYAWLTLQATLQLAREQG